MREVKRTKEAPGRDYEVGRAASAGQTFTMQDRCVLSFKYKPWLIKELHLRLSFCQAPCISDGNFGLVCSPQK